MLKQIIEFSEKVQEVWDENSLRNYLEKDKIFLNVELNDNLEYDGFSIVGLENPFPTTSKLAKKFQNLEEWMYKNREKIEYTNFKKYYEPNGSNNNAIGGSQSLGTNSLTHLKIFKIDEEDKNDLKNKALMQYKKKIEKTVSKISELTKKLNETDINNLKNSYEKFFEDFFDILFDDLINFFSENNKKIYKIVEKKYVLIFHKKLLEIHGKTSSDIPRYFNTINEKKTFLIKRRNLKVTNTRSAQGNDKKYNYNINLLKGDNEKIKNFLTILERSTERLFVLPIDENLQDYLADIIRIKKTSFFENVENIIKKQDKGRENTFDFYLISIIKKEIKFFDYVTGYKYYLGNFENVFPFEKSNEYYNDFNRKNLKEKFGKIFDSYDLVFLPWSKIPKNFNTKKKSTYLKVVDKLFQTIYIGKNCLIQNELKEILISLIEDSIKNDNKEKINGIIIEGMNLYANHKLFTIGGKMMNETNVLEISKEIKKQINEKDYQPKNNESGFYFLGMLLSELAEKSESQNNKAKLLQPIFNSQTVGSLKRVVCEKFIEKYGSKIDDDEKELKDLINNVLTYLAGQKDEISIQNFKLWIYAGFFYKK